jgi:hypothetical protein
MIVKSTGKLNLENYCDCDFAGIFSVEPGESPVSVKSWTGFIIFLAGCPLVWKSQLQSTIALSTFHSEYNGLSHSMRIMIPLRGLLLETVAVLELLATIHCRAFEDNNSRQQQRTSSGELATLDFLQQIPSCQVASFLVPCETWNH